MKIRTMTEHPSSVDVFSALRGDRKAVFLDSSLHGEDGRFSIIGLDPYLELVQTECFTVNGIRTPGRIGDYLKQYLKSHQQVNTEDLPLTAGCIGYFSYDYGRREMEIAARDETGPKEDGWDKTVRDQAYQDDRIPEAVWIFYDKFIIEDHQNGTMTAVCTGKGNTKENRVDRVKRPDESGDKSTDESLEKCLDRLCGQIRGIKSFAGESDDSLPQVSADFEEKDYLKAVESMIRYITDGDIYVTNMTQQLRISSSMDPYRLFLNLRKNNPSPFGAYMDYGSFQIVCASPERFLKVQDGIVRTSPIKGTRKRGTTPEEDEALRRELEESEKDRSELLMIVDLERNDLSRVCRPGSVRVTNLFYVKSYATVHHLVTDIEGKLNEDAGVMDLLDAAFPGGSITGAPKRRAMEIIDELEHTKRNLYTGSLGYISLDGSCDLNIVIRTAVRVNGVYELGVGGGITCESDPEFEYIETLQKARAVLEAFGITKEDGNEYYSG